MAEEWYKDGLRFECTMCGNCCTGGEGAVWFTDDEGKAMAAELGIPHEDFLARFTRVVRNRRSLTEHSTPHGMDCTFLDRETMPGKALCKVYRTRPSQCRTWPFWPDNLESRRAWVMAKKHAPCPGMDQGKLVPIEQIRIQRDLDLRDNGDAPW